MSVSDLLHNCQLFINVSQDGFVEFYEGSPERKKESPWPSFKTLCGYAVGALGVLTLGAILAHRSS